MVWYSAKSPVCCVKIVKTCPALLRYYLCTLVKVYVDERVQFSVDGDPELGNHCGKGEYACNGFFNKKIQKVTHLELWCSHNLGVHQLCMP